MNTIPKEWLEFLREQFPEGSQIKIKETAEPHPPFALGEQGKLEQIDNNGCFHVRMSGGTLLTLVLGEDRFSVSPPAPTMMKLYMPLTADLYTRNEYGEMEEDSTLLDGRSLRAYEGEILRALINSRMPEESESGIMHWYGKDDNLSFVVTTYSAVLNSVVDQYREAYEALGLFDAGQCEPDSHSRLDYEGKVLVLSPDSMKESCWSQRNQLWYANNGTGCSPHAIGRSIRCTCLGNGEMTRWNRADFIGVLEDRYLPAWAVEKLAELKNAEQSQNSHSEMGEMTMN